MQDKKVLLFNSLLQFFQSLNMVLSQEGVSVQHIAFAQAFTSSIQACRFC